VIQSMNYLHFIFHYQVVLQHLRHWIGTILQNG
jgi:hypothetical protein